MNRRHFLASISTIPFLKGCSDDESAIAANKADFSMSRTIISTYYENNECFVHARCGVTFDSHNNIEAILTMNLLDVTGTDIFKAMYQLKSTDKGKSWSSPEKVEELSLKNNLAISDFYPDYHFQSKQLIGIGHTVEYNSDQTINPIRKRNTVYSFYRNGKWSTPTVLDLPNQQDQSSIFYNSGAGSVQRLELDNGNLLLPIYYSNNKEKTKYSCLILKCQIEKEKIIYLQSGNPISISDNSSGLSEPAIIKYNNKYYLTLRHDKRSYITTSNDGLNYEEIQPWRFDNGSLVETYNTQTKFLKSPSSLYLIYTRKGLNNDHVFRHRAPLLIAKVDTKNICLIKSTEKILVPNRGARLGNFGVTHISKNEVWITVSEWMQTWPPNYILQKDNPYGSNGSTYLIKLFW